MYFLDEVAFFLMVAVFADRHPVFFILLLIGIPTAIAAILYLKYALFMAIVNKLISKQAFPNDDVGEKIKNTLRLDELEQEIKSKKAQIDVKQDVADEPGDEQAFYCLCGARLNGPGAYCSWCGRTGEQGSPPQPKQRLSKSESIADSKQVDTSSEHLPLISGELTASNESALHQQENFAWIPEKTAKCAAEAVLGKAQAAYSRAAPVDRFLAGLIDGAASFLLILATVLVTWGYFQVIISIQELNQYLSTFIYVCLALPLAISLLVTYLTVLGYVFFRDGMKGGAGFGKRFFGLMVVHLADNKPCNLKQSFFRTIIRLPGIDEFLICTGDRGQRVGDLLVGTQVIEAIEFYNPLVRQKTFTPYPKAPFLLRLYAKLWDILVVALPFVSVYVITFIAMEVFFVNVHVDADNVLDFMFIPFLFMIVITGCVGFALLYMLLRDSLKGGASFGKRRFGLMVVDLNTDMPCKRKQSFLRQAISCIFVFQVLDLPLALLAQRGRTTGDYAADTQVVLVADYLRLRPSTNTLEIQKALQQQ